MNNIKLNNINLNNIDIVIIFINLNYYITCLLLYILFNISDDEEEYYKTINKKMRYKMALNTQDYNDLVSYPIIDLALANGFEIKREDAKCYYLKGYNGLVIYKNNNVYYNFSEGDKGNIIKFCQKYLGIEKLEDMAGFVLNREIKNNFSYKPRTEFSKRQLEKGDLKLPEKSSRYNHLYAYLINQRGIDVDIINELVQRKIIYQASELDVKGRMQNYVVFLGKDDKYNVRYASICSTLSYVRFKKEIENSDKSYPFVIKGDSKKVFVFESPIDTISFYNLMKRQSNTDRQYTFLSLGGLSDKGLENFAYNHDVSEIHFCLDNDFQDEINHGQETANKLAIKYQKLGYVTSVITPRLKDFNDVLREFKAEMEIER